MEVTTLGELKFFQRFVLENHLYIKIADRVAMDITTGISTFIPEDFLVIALEKHTTIEKTRDIEINDIYVY